MVSLCTNCIWLIVWIKIKFFQPVLFWWLVWNWWCIFLQFPLFKSQIRKSKYFIFYFRIKDNFHKILSLVYYLSNFFSSIFAYYMNTVEVNLSISLVINISKLSDWISSWIFFFMSLDRINFNHLISALPKNIYSWISIDWHYYT